ASETSGATDFQGEAKACCQKENRQTRQHSQPLQASADKKAMTLGEASAGFLEHLKSTKRDERCEAATIAQALELLNTFLPEATLEDLTHDRLRDFIARWYVEQTSHQPSPRDLLNSLDAFLNWVDVNAGSAIQGDCSAMIAELNDSLPRALEITATLSSQLGSGGAFGFPEFLTSFEEGGRS